MEIPAQPNDQELLHELSKGSSSAMEKIFRANFPLMCKAAYRILPDPAVAEDISQDILLELWRRRDDLTITGSLGAYLRRAVVNRTLNYIRDQRLHLKEGEEALQKRSAPSKAQGQLEKQELELQIEKAIEQLPDRCRLVFVLSRYEELSYAEIAEKLEISIKTVENQISKALKLLRKSLAPYIGGD